MTPHSPIRSSPAAETLTALVEAVKGVEAPVAVADARTPGAPILFANLSAATLAGRPQDMLEGLPPAALASSAAASLAVAGITACVNAGALGRVRSVTLPPGTGSTIETLCCAPVRSPDGEVLYLLCAAFAGNKSEAQDAKLAAEKLAALLGTIASAAEALVIEAEEAAQSRRFARSATEIVQQALHAARIRGDGRDD